MKRFFLALATILSVFTLIGCATRFSYSSNSEKERKTEHSLIVYDNNGQEVLETQDPTIIDKFLEYASKDSVDVQEMFEETPKDAQLAYSFVLKEKSDYEINMQVYSNNDYLTILDIPILGDIQMKLPKEEADWFRNPEKW